MILSCKILIIDQRYIINNSVVNIFWIQSINLGCSLHRQMWVNWNARIYRVWIPDRLTARCNICECGQSIRQVQYTTRRLDCNDYHTQYCDKVYNHQPSSSEFNELFIYTIESGSVDPSEEVLTGPCARDEIIFSTTEVSYLNQFIC